MWNWVKNLRKESVPPDLTYYDPYATLEKYPPPRSLRKTVMPSPGGSTPSPSTQGRIPLRDDDPIDHSALSNRDYTWRTGE